MRRFLSDERLLRVFTFQALYAGVPPQSALAVYAVIAYMDTVAGVYFPRGGMRALPDAMAAAAADAGVEFVYGATVSELECSGSRVTAVRTADGQRVPADAVVLTTELPDTYRLLGRTPRRLLRLRPAPSAVVAHVGCRAVGRSSRPPHHPVRRRLEADLPRHHRRRPGDGGPVAAGDPADRRRSDAGAARARPALRAGAGAQHRSRARWIGTPLGRPTSSRCSARSRERLPELGDDAEVLHVVTPADWAPPGHGGGHPVRVGAHLRPDRPVPAGQHRARRRQRGAGRLVDRARGRRPDRGHVRPAGRRPDHRSARAAAESGGRTSHDQLRTRRRRCPRPVAARGLPAVPRRSTPATARPSSWPPGCWRPGSGPPCTRCTDSPGAPTTSSTTSTAARDVEQRAEQLQQLSTQLFNSLVENQPCGDDPTLTAVVHTARKLRHRLGPVRRLPGVDADGPDGHRLSRPRRAGALHVRLGGGDRPADAADSGHRRPAGGRRAARRRARKGVPAHQLPARRRRGPAARPGVPARRRTGRPRRRP